VWNTSGSTKQGSPAGTPFEDRRGLYARKDFSADFERQIMLACKRVPNGIVCLKSAVRFHGFLPVDAASIWMAIDF